MNDKHKELVGKITKVRYHKASGSNSTPFLIAEIIDGNGKKFVVKGNMADYIYNAEYKFCGDFVIDKFGESFAFFLHEPAIEAGVNGAIQFLSRFIPSIGKGRAKLIAEHFGDETLSILRSNPQSVEQVPGVTQLVTNALVEYFENHPYLDPVAYGRLVDLFSAHKVSRRIIDALLRDHGSSAPDFVEKYPYRLIGYRGIGFPTVDNIAINKCGYDPNGIDRHVEAIVEALTIISNNGHTYALRIDAEIKVHQLIGTPPLQPAIEYAIDTDRISSWVDESGNENWSYKNLENYERRIATEIRRLVSNSTNMTIDLSDESFNEGQLEAARLIAKNPIFILTGSAGTGKTYLTTKIIKKYVDSGLGSIAFAAPTGKAAKRGQELFSQLIPDSPIVFSTIHQLLGPVPFTDGMGASPEEAKINRENLSFRFEYTKENPLPLDFVILDEFSMCDIEIASQLFEAIPSSCQVLIIGDPHQLPSVGPGSVLRDLIAAGVPSIELTEVRRASGEIVAACHAIKDGANPTPCEALDLAGGKNWIHIEEDDPNEILAQIGELVRNSTRFDKIWGIQVVSAQKGKLPFGCDSVNALLSRILNPKEADDPESVRRGFSKNDKVVRTKNELVQMFTPVPKDNEKVVGFIEYNDVSKSLTENIPLTRQMIVNGDMGIVKDFITYKKKEYVVVDFTLPDRRVLLPMDEHHLIRAYALTVHKSQGSGFPCVICPVHHSFYWDNRQQVGLLNRELIYTAVSRAAMVLITVGQIDALYTAIGRKTIHARKTRLKSFVTEKSDSGANLRKKARRPVAGGDSVRDNSGFAGAAALPICDVEI
jgi:exodeoxyribonuclease V alpha subunit